MKGQPKISVIMGVYNERNTEALCASIDSVLNQTFKDFEFIIYNDGSDSAVTEALVDIIKWDEKKQLSLRDERILLAGKEENRGLSYSLNECISLASGKYIARMDADDMSFENRLERQYDFLENNKEYAWCGCAAELFDSNGVWGSRHLPKEPAREDYLKYSPFIHPTVMFRSCIFEERNGYLESDETLRCEDYEIFMRLQEEGLKGYNMPDILFRYREDMYSYRRRSIKNRVNEMKVRYRYFKRLKLLSVATIPCVIRPLAGAFVPGVFIAFVKKLEGRRDVVGYETKKVYDLPQYTKVEEGMLLSTKTYS